MDNPFLHRIVATPWRAGKTDIPEINRPAFRHCLDALETVKKGHHGFSVVLHGEPGSGKTHLLGRLRRYLHVPKFTCVFASIRLQTGPGGFWRNMRKQVTDSLLCPIRHGRSQLELMFLIRLGRLLKLYGHEEQDARVPKEIHEKAVARLCSDAGLSHNLFAVTKKLATRQFRRDAAAWLRGDPIPEYAIKNLDLIDQDNTLDPEDDAREIILALCRLASPMPVVLCFDQIEALQRYPGDKEGLFVLGQAVRTLIDETENLLLVNCVQTFFLPLMKEAIAVPDYDALAGILRSLNPLTVDESMKLIEARIASHPDIAGRWGELMPRFRERVEDLGPIRRTARNVLARSADIVDELQGTKGDTRTISINDYIAGESERRLEREMGRINPDHTDEIIRTAVPRLLRFIDDRWTETDEKPPRDVDFILKGPGTRVGISLCNQQDMKRLAARMRRIRNLAKEDHFDDLVVVRHPDLPVSTHARKVRAYFDDLKQSAKVRVIAPNPEALAALSSLRDLLAEAQSGDLTVGDRLIDGETVRNWLKRHLSGAAGDLLNAFVSPREADTAFEDHTVQDVLELLKQERVMTLEAVAGRLNQDVESLEDRIRRIPERIGFLTGPPPVVFQFIPV